MMVVTRDYFVGENDRDVGDKDGDVSDNDGDVGGNDGDGGDNDDDVGDNEDDSDGGNNGDGEDDLHGNQPIRKPLTCAGLILERAREPDGPYLVVGLSCFARCEPGRLSHIRLDIMVNQ